MAGVVAHTCYSLASPPEKAFNQHFCIITKPQDEAWPFDWAKQSIEITEVKKASSERELLSLLLMKFQKLDPDIIIGHDVGCFDLEVLTHRMVVCKIPNWSKLGRLRRSNQAELGKRAMEKQATVGRLVADLKISAKELIRCKSYELFFLFSFSLLFSGHSPLMLRTMQVQELRAGRLGGEVFEG